MFFGQHGLPDSRTCSGQFWLTVTVFPNKLGSPWPGDFSNSILEGLLAQLLPAAGRRSFTRSLIPSTAGPPTSERRCSPLRSLGSVVAQGS